MDDILNALAILMVAIMAVGLALSMYQDWRRAREFEQWWKHRR